jgi:hypothetical protein
MVRRTRNMEEGEPSHQNPPVPLAELGHNEGDVAESAARQPQNPPPPISPVDLAIVLDHQNRIFEMLAAALIGQGNNKAPVPR